MVIIVKKPMDGKTLISLLEEMNFDTRVKTRSKREKNVVKPSNINGASLVYG